MTKMKNLKQNHRTELKGCLWEDFVIKFLLRMETVFVSTREWVICILYRREFEQDLELFGSAFSLKLFGRPNQVHLEFKLEPLERMQATKLGRKQLIWKPRRWERRWYLQQTVSNTEFDEKTIFDDWAIGLCNLPRRVLRQKKVLADKESELS